MGERILFPVGSYTYTNRTAETYLRDFFGTVGGSPWAGVQTQYCEGAAIGAVNCNGALGAQFVQNPSSMLKGAWVDPTAVLTAEPCERLVAAGVAFVGSTR